MVIKTRIRRATEQHRSNFSADNQDHDQSFPAAIVYSDQLCYWCLSLSPQLKFCQFEPGEQNTACFCSRLFVLRLVKSNLSSELYTSLFIYMKLARLGCQATSHKKHKKTLHGAWIWLVFVSSVTAANSSGREEDSEEVARWQWKRSYLLIRMV